MSSFRALTVILFIVLVAIPSTPIGRTYGATGEIGRVLSKSRQHKLIALQLSKVRLDGSGMESLQTEIILPLSEIEHYKFLTLSARSKTSGPLAWISLSAGENSDSDLSAMPEDGDSLISVTSRESLPFEKLRIGFHSEENTAEFSEFLLLFHTNSNLRSLKPGLKEKYVIGLMGHSTIAGYQRSPIHSIPNLLQMKLDTYFPGRFRVVNLGRASGCILNQLLRFEYDCNIAHWQIPGAHNFSYADFDDYILKCISDTNARKGSWREFKLDYVIFSPMWNDYDMLKSPATQRAWLHGSPIHSIISDRLVSEIVRSRKSNITKAAELYRQSRQYSPGQDPDSIQQYARRVLEDWTRQMLILLSERNIDSSIMLLPQACARRTEICNLYGLGSKLTENLFESEESQRLIFSKVAGDNKLSFIDAAARYNRLLADSRLTPKKIDKMHYFGESQGRDVIHMSERGNQFVADVIFNTLRNDFSARHASQ